MANPLMPDRKTHRHSSRTYWWTGHDRQHEQEGERPVVASATLPTLIAWEATGTIEHEDRNAFNLLVLTTARSQSRVNVTARYASTFNPAMHRGIVIE